MIKQIFLYFIFLNVCLVFSPAQEVVTGLQSNYLIIKSKENQVKNKSLRTSATLELPFFDDFSGRSVFPDPGKWTDDYVFINNTYSDRQITTGVATFDAIDNSGRLYETASSSGFEADHLTSQPLNLTYTASDNIWLSFFYQAGGLGDPPETKDSLTLQFFAPTENKWYSVWKVEGSADQKFKPAVIRIDNSRFLKNGFQFRFINYASLSPNPGDPSMVGNCDIWNVDYVLLDKNRNAADTIFTDVAFRLPIRSLLKNHEAMPWKQFREIELQEMASSIPIHYRNNDTIVRNVTRNFEIWDVYKNSQVDFFSAGATNINPLTNVDYNANLIYSFNTENKDSALFRITCSLKTDEFDPKGNDTIVYYQVFKNYFAFDDGSSEAGYGINGLGSRNAMVANRFVSYIPDTLRAIRICFNESYLDANKRAFDLMVWDDNNGIPGNVIFSREDVMVEQENMINGFYAYNIPEGVIVNGKFYIGWKQRSETFLNAGFDINTPHANRQFYWLNGEWLPSQMQGSLMIRPVVGGQLKITGINNIYYKGKNIIRIWPNPATDILNFDKGELQLSDPAYITFLDLSGRELIKIPYSEQVDISSLHEGSYIVVTSINGKPVGYNRLIKVR
ncbi:MAG: T9SS type A sorting domain-containing protein [Bacteroidetes bacterium]|nr:MAG: T9SS type A sorting domain-containing protein [Bacteroidota bacterium]